MQTFMPYSRFDASAAVLDDLRLGKQRVETLQILRELVWPTYRGWKNHPATAMWRGFTDALVCYGVAICTEWERRGRADAVRRSLEQFSGTPTAGEDQLALRGRMPPWLGSPSFHAGHRASLVAELSTPPLLRGYRLSALREESVRQQLPSVNVVVAEGLPDVRAVRRIFPDATLVRLPAL